MTGDDDTAHAHGHRRRGDGDGDTDTDGDHGPVCGCADEGGDAVPNPPAGDEAGFAGDPDFTVETADKTHRVFWRPAEHFEDHDSFGKWTAGYAGINADYIVLNEFMSAWITPGVIAHEVGHNLGYGHTDGTLMDASVIGQDDGQPDVDLAETTAEICRQIDEMRVFDWRSDARRSILRLMAAYSKREYGLSYHAVVYGLGQYNRGTTRDALFLSNLGLTADDVPSSNLRRGHFYGHDSH